MKLFLAQLVIALTLLAGCASRSLDESDLERLNEEGTISNQSAVKHRYRLDYLVDGQPYSFTTYSLADSDSYLWILARRDQILSVSVAVDPVQSLRPAVEQCTLFPYHADSDVNSCLRNFNDSIISRHDSNWLTSLSPALQTTANEHRDSENITATMLAFAPVILPASLLAAPFLAGDYLSDQGQRKEFYLALGNENDLSGFLDSLDQELVSISHERGTAYVASGFAMKTPAIAFGFSGSEVIWIQKKPNWSCGGGFMFWNQRCTIGSHPDRHF